MSLWNDKIATVRMEFVHSIVSLKPYLDYDKKINFEFIDILNSLRTDPDGDIIEAGEQCEYDLLQKNKKVKNDEKQKLEQENERIEFESRLQQRENQVIIL